MERNIIVSINCLVYNQAPFLRQCLDGFVMQKTNFKFEAVVHDDASTDGSAAIIREYAERYPDIIKPIFETENQYSKHDCSLNRIMEAHLRGKYIAFCEGDDYWTDPCKLQMQVDALEKDEDRGLCYTKASVVKNKKIIGIKSCGYCSFNQLILNNDICTLTVLIRRNIYLNYLSKIRPENNQWLMGDYPIWLYVALNSKIVFINKNTSHYRVLEESATHSKDPQKIFRFNESVREIRKYFVKFIIDKVHQEKLNQKIEYSYILNAIHIYKQFHLRKKGLFFILNSRNTLKFDEFVNCLLHIL